MIRSTTTAMVTALCLGCCAAVALGGGVLPDLRVEVLDSGTGTESEALGVHEDLTGDALAIVGTVTVGGTVVPAYWEPDITGAFVLTLLPDIGGNGGSAEAVTVDVADYGVVATGTVEDAGGTDQPCTWSRPAAGDPFTLTLLPTSGNGGRATSIARLDSGGLGIVGPPLILGIGGHVIGVGGATGATVWVSTGGGPWVPQSLGGLTGGGPNSRVLDLTAMGDDWLAVGTAQNAAPIERAVHWTHTSNAWGDATVFPLPMGSGLARATGVSRTAADGSTAAACGRVTGAGGVVHAFRWAFDGMTWSALDLGTVVGFANSQGADLTLRGAGETLILGRSDDGAALDAGVATAWAPIGMAPGAVDLNTLVSNPPAGLTLRWANHVADRTVTPFGTGDFQIAGVASLSGPGPALAQAVLITSAPEALPVLAPAGVAVSGTNGSSTNDVIRHGSSGGTVAYSVGVTVCNLGSAAAEWNINTTQHPVFAQNMYRLMDGRFEHIGQSWLKHGFAAVDQTYCGPCAATADSFHLGVGCSDPYSAALNANVTLLRSKRGVDPVSGAILPPWPDFEQPAGVFPGLLQVAQSDLIPSEDPAAPRYFFEIQILHPVAGSSRAYRECDVLPGQVVDVSGYPTIGGSPLDNEPVWDATAADAETGHTRLYAQVTQIGKAQWRYEYALHNLAFVPALATLTVPVVPGVVVTNSGFADVPFHSGDPYDGTDWSVTVDPDAVSWATAPAVVDPDANAQRWGTVYNFWFDAAAPPIAGTVTAEAFDPQPGDPGVLTYGVVVPGSACAVAACADGDDNGVRDDPCTWWSCVDESCDATMLTAFADVGGAFGACPPDGFSNIHDRNHVLVCFAGSNTCDDVNLDAGGPFGTCPPDGFCNIHDANHALNVFAGTNACTCPSGPAPSGGPDVVDTVPLRLVPTARGALRPGARFDVHVFVDGPIAALSSYQVVLAATGGRTGQVVLDDIVIEERDDGVFAARRDRFSATNPTTAAVLSGLDALDGVGLRGAGYLATYRYRVLPGASGAFVIDAVELDTAQTCLIAPGDGQIAIGGTTPAVVHVDARRTGASRGKDRPRTE